MSAIPGVCLYIFQVMQSLDEVLADIETVAGRVSGFKSTSACEGLKKVAFVCDCEGRHPVAEKVPKIVVWPACRNITEARAIIRICVYYSAWIKGFLVVPVPIFRLSRHSHTTAKALPEKKGKGSAWNSSGAQNKRKRWRKRRRRLFRHLR